MKPLLALALIFSLSHAEIEVTELFRAETPEELEAALVDGYPMPWLAEVLADSTIPEEDRYWLDCRMRAHIAKHLHVFYDRSGNPVEVEAEWIAPGEPYWQEHVMVNPVGEDYGWEPPEGLPRFTGEPGTIMNLYGEQTGEFALTQRGIMMSRDGTIGVINTGPGSFAGPSGPDYMCFLYSDGTFNEVPTELIGQWEFVNISQDGQLGVACCVGDDFRGYLQVFDRDGNTLYTTDLSGETSDISLNGVASARPAISPDNRFIAIPMASPERAIIVVDAITGRILKSFPVVFASTVGFSPGADRLFSAPNSSSIGILSLVSPVDSWQFDVIEPEDSVQIHDLSLCSNLDLLGIFGKTRQRPASYLPFDHFSSLNYQDREVLRTDRSDLDLSPNGHFAFAFNSRDNARTPGYPPSCASVFSIETGR